MAILMSRRNWNHDQGRLDPLGNACINLPAGNVDLLDAVAVKRSSNRDHRETGVGRQLGHQLEVIGL